MSNLGVAFPSNTPNLAHNYDKYLMSSIMSVKWKINKIFIMKKKWKINTINDKSMSGKHGKIKYVQTGIRFDYFDLHILSWLGFSNLALYTDPLLSLLLELSLKKRANSVQSHRDMACLSKPCYGIKLFSIPVWNKNVQ